MAAQYELLKELLNSGTKLSFGQDFFFKFYQGAPNRASRPVAFAYSAGVADFGTAWT